MPKEVNIIIKDDGTVGISFDGFDGDECYREADQIKDKLKALGINMNLIQSEPNQSDDCELPKIRKTVKESNED